MAIPSMMNKMTVNDIQQLNLTIESYAKDSDWDKVASLTLERHQLIQRFFEEDENSLNEQTLLSIQAALQSSDKIIHSMITQQKKSSIQSSIDLRNSYKAVNEYRKTRNVSTEI